MTHKEELRKKFDDFIDKNNDIVAVIDSYDSKLIFDFFYSEIEAREKRLEEMESDMIDIYKEKRDLQAKISHLESLVKEADGIVRQYEMGDLSQVELCIKHYNQLKTKSQS